MAEKKGAAQSGVANDKKKALEAAMSQIEKAYGAGSVMVLGQNANMNVDAIPTGSFSLDLALGIGGVPRGRIVEIYGPKVRVRPLLLYISLRKRRSAAARLLLWTRNTHLTRYMREISALI